MTICSNQILQMTLPEVSAERFASRTVNGTYYNVVVSLDAVCYDEKGNPYVLVLEARETPLGKRHFVRRVPVSIQETDPDTGLAAIEGALSGEDLIVYRKDTELEDGQEVRFVNNFLPQKSQKKIAFFLQKKYIEYSSFAGFQTHTNTGEGI